jgi:hypothetical protein
VYKILVISTQLVTDNNTTSKNGGDDCDNGGLVEPAGGSALEVAATRRTISASGDYQNT